MAVVTLYQSDRDLSKTFTEKKDADVYDKLLELTQNLGSWMKRNVPDLSDAQSQTLGTLIAQNKTELIKAFKGKSDLLLETSEVDEATNEATDEAVDKATDEADDNAIASND